MAYRSAINLARGQTETFLDKFVNWALTIGRVLVIATEAIALAAFLYRFTLDRQIIDLHTKIKQEQTIVKLLNKNETTYRNLQDRLHLIGSLQDDAANKYQLAKSIYDTKPDDIIITTFDMDAKGFELEAALQSTKSLTQFMKSLRGVPSIQKLSLTHIENRTSTATLIIGLAGTFKQQQQQNP